MTTAPRPTLWVSYDEDTDYLRLVVAGVVIDDPLDEETELLAWCETEDGELRPRVRRWTQGADGPLAGFGVGGAREWNLSALAFDDPLWRREGVDAPTLGVRDGSLAELVLAAQAVLCESTPDVIAWDHAVHHACKDRWTEAETWWRRALAAGELQAHYGLGYTLVELGRPHEAFGHLRHYTDLVPRHAWSWCWRGQAAEAMGELAEARRCYDRALALEADLDVDEDEATDAAERLEALDAA